MRTDNSPTNGFENLYRGYKLAGTIVWGRSLFLYETLIGVPKLSLQELTKLIRRKADGYERKLGAGRLIKSFRYLLRSVGSG